MNKPRIIHISQPATGDEEWHALREPLATGWLTQGPKIEEFEKHFAVRHQVKHALATTSCTTALHLILAAMEIGPGDEVIVPAFTWVATANAVVYCGATPVFADIDRNTYNVDPRDVARKITPRTRAIIAVHLFGLCANMDAIARAAPGIPIIEDAACASGSAYHDRAAGSVGLAAAFSFHPRKSITTGEGGMVTTNDDSLAERVGILRNHGAEASEDQRRLGPKPYLLASFNLLGFNYRMTELQAAMGLVQLSKLDRYVDERQQWAAFYSKKFEKLQWLHTPVAPEYSRHSWQSYVCFVDPARAPLTRDQVMDRLMERNISTRPGTHAVHMLGYYRERFALRPDDCPAARDCESQTISLPLHNRMSPEDYASVAEALLEIGS